MDPPRPPSSHSSPTSSSLFQVYLRLRPPPQPQQTLQQERYLTVEPPVLAAPSSPDESDACSSSTGTPAQSRPDTADSNIVTSSEPPHPTPRRLPPTHITIHPPSDSRKRAVEKFAFTRVFEEDCEQIDMFSGVGVAGIVEGVLKGDGRDGLLATLGVTGSGKSHTILGSKSQRGLLQLSLDLLYRSLDAQVIHPSQHASLVASLCATDASEAQIFSAQTFLDNMYGCETASNSRANTPMVSTAVGRNSDFPSSVPVLPSQGPRSQWEVLSLLEPPNETSVKELEMKEVFPPKRRIRGPESETTSQWKSFSPFIPCVKRTLAKFRTGLPPQEFQSFIPNFPKQKRLPPRPIPALLSPPDISNITVPIAAKTEYCILVSMYEVYNDRIFDLLSGTASTSNNPKDLRRRHLLFKPTEASPDRKVVAGLRKVVCGTYEEALLILETGLHERRVAGTGSNSVSSRSHGFFCVEVKRRTRGGMSSAWTGATLTIVDLAGSERARNAKTAGATLAEAGKINESLMYLGQCLQMQSDQSHDGNKPTLVPFRQCKLTELLFSNSFPHHNPNHQSSAHTHHRNPQKAIMIVTADPVGDFNATSQILRYSALAREVTIPRIPSVSSTILAGLNTTGDCSQRTPSGSSQPSPRADDTMVDMAFSEIARLNEEIEILNLRLTDEESRRREAEEGWQRAEERAEDLEAEVREECWGEMETKMAEERRRWVNAWGEETDRNEEHLDRKLDILSQGIQIHEDPEAKEEYTAQLEEENESLKRRVESLERELRCQSPTKAPKIRDRDSDKMEKQPPKLPSLGLGHLSGSVHNSGIYDRDDEATEMGGSGASSFLNSLNGLSMKAAAETVKASSSPARKATGAAPAATPGTAGKKMRKLTARKWDLMDESALEEYY